MHQNICNHSCILLLETEVIGLMLAEYGQSLSYLGLTVLGLVPVGQIRATSGFVLLIVPEWCFCCGSLFLVLMYV